MCNAKCVIDCNSNRKNQELFTFPVIIVPINIEVIYPSLELLKAILFPLTYAQQQITGLYNPATNPIKYILVIMQENRSFDN